MLQVNSRIAIADDELQWSFVRSSGPGGQNVNKVASKAVLRWNLAGSPGVPDEIKARLQAQNPGRVNEAGEVVLTSQRFRDQLRNKEDCLSKLREMILQAAARPKKRRPTKPSRAAKERRLQEKKRRSSRKTGRRGPAED
jgi:ribosome-associated protein